MKIRFLGTGTSHGIPVIGCFCETCSSSDPRNTRYRTCVHLQEGEFSFLIDISPEFRLRAIEYSILRLDAILLTHSHSDHCSGLDDIRRYNQIQEGSIPVFGNTLSLGDLKEKFSYIFKQTQEGGGKPKIDLKPVQNYSPFFIRGIEILPLPVLHGNLEILGFRIGGFAFITDVTEIPEKTFECLKNLDVLVLDALRFEEHPTHFTIYQAIDAAKKIGAKRTFFTHMSHSLEHAKTEELLPESMWLSYDGLELEVPSSLSLK